MDKKTPQEAINLFEGVIKASVKNNPKPKAKRKPRAKAKKKSTK